MISKKIINSLKKIRIELDDNAQLCEAGNEDWIINGGHNTMVKLKNIKSFNQNHECPIYKKAFMEGVEGTSVYSFEKIYNFIQIIKSKYNQRELKNVNLQISMGGDYPIVIEEITPDNEVGFQFLLAPKCDDKKGECVQKHPPADFVLHVHNLLKNKNINDLSDKDKTNILKYIKNDLSKYVEEDKWTQ